jgi:hypothetical protein
MAAAGLNISGEAQAELVKIAAFGLVAIGALWWLNQVRLGAVSTVSDAIDEVLAMPGRIVTAAGEAVDAAGAAVQGAVLNVRQSVADSNPANPGYALPAGWYRVQTWQGEILTRYPDQYKSLNRWDSVLIDP